MSALGDRDPGIVLHISTRTLDGSVRDTLPIFARCGSTAGPSNWIVASVVPIPWNSTVASIISNRAKGSMQSTEKRNYLCFASDLMRYSVSSLNSPWVASPRVDVMLESLELLAKESELRSRRSNRWNAGDPAARINLRKTIVYNNERITKNRTTYLWAEYPMPPETSITSVWAWASHMDKQFSSYVLSDTYTSGGRGFGGM